MAKKKDAPITMNPREVEAISLVRQEKQRWEDAVAFVTEAIAFKMRDLIRMNRKNFYGIYDYPYDESTGREKIWYPLTEIFVNAAVKNFDLDTKDVGFRAKNENGYAMTDLTRAVVRDYLDKMNFGEILDMSERMLAIDGTIVWKTFEREGKMIRRDCDLLNVYLDPTSPSIKEAYRFTERSLQYPGDISRMSGWLNTEDFRPMAGLPRTDPVYNMGGNVYSNVMMVDVYECWGKFPLYIFTGEEADRNTEVDGQVVVSGLDTPGKERCHLIKRNENKDSFGDAMKPYEEGWYERVPGRWYGKGIAEKLMPFQLYANEILNIRRNRNYVTQLGLFKVRRGSGITPQQLRRLPSNGAVLVSNMDDLQQFVMQDIPASSYNDDKIINDVAQKVTSAFDVVMGEQLPASTPATNAMIQNNNAKSMFTMIRDELGMFLKRWLDNHGLPIIAKNLKGKDIVRIDGSDEKVKGIFENIVAYHAIEELEENAKVGVIPSEVEVIKALQLWERKLMNRKDLFIKLVDKMMGDEIETEIYFTNEALDIGVTTQRLLTTLQLAPEFKEPIVKQIFDLMGLPMPVLPPTPQQSQGPMTGQQNSPQIQPQQVPQGQPV